MPCEEVGMTNKKKRPAFSASQAETAQAQDILGHYHQIAATLRKSTSRAQAAESLAEINNLPEAAQVALAKALSREHQTDAADLLVGINELASQKNARKEAKRSLIQLESQRIYPNWKAPVEERSISLFSPSSGTSYRRFWKGLVSDTLSTGVLQLVLCWEQGSGYRRVLAYIFFLDFIEGGVKELVAMQDERKEDFEATAARVAKSMESPFKDCSLAHGRSLLKKALEINDQSGTKLPAEYRRNLSLIKELILDAPGLEDEEIDLDFLDEEEEEDEGEIDLSGLEPVAVVTNFVGYWASDDFDIAYRLLATGSPLREGLSEEEWDNRRYDWAEENDPGELRPIFAEEREKPKSKLWLPRSISGKGDENQKVVEASWSLELFGLSADEEQDESSLDQEQDELTPGEEQAETPAGEESEDTAPVEPLPELTTPSFIYQETGRCWYWASFTLVQDQGEWRIQSITDEVAQARGLSTLEVRAKIEEYNKQLDELTSKESGLAKKIRSEDDLLTILRQMISRMSRLSYYVDVLIERNAVVDLQLMEDIAGLMALLGFQERGLAYLEYIAQHSEEKRIANLANMADARRLLSRSYDEKGYKERAGRFRAEAEQELKELLDIQDDADTHILVVELMLDSRRFDEAEEHLLLAKTMTSDPAQVAHIEVHLGQIAEERQLFEESLYHYQLVAELLPDQASSWSDLAKAHARLDNLQEAERHFRHAIELDPQDVELYSELSDLYEKAGEPEKAVEILEEALEAHPDSTSLLFYMATLYLQRDDYDEAARYVERIAQLDPEFEYLDTMRSVLALLKANAPRGKSGRLKPVTPLKLGSPRKKH
jgi:tetratricopeptide (TPR) repeat protein